MDDWQLPPIGLEEEVFTGLRSGQVVGISADIATDLPGFSTEPDLRTIEYRTPAFTNAEALIRNLAQQRVLLRRYLEQGMDLTIIPGGTLSLGDSTIFQLSDEENPYYTWIRENYGTRVVTAGLHLNVGISDMHTLFRAYRVLRCEAVLFLALTACSPFLDNRLTGFQSTRWCIFPRTPEHVPFFYRFADFRAWIVRQLATKKMRNSRHLWLAVRPNGPDKLKCLDRVELRICDQFWNLHQLIEIVELLQRRAAWILNDTRTDPLAVASDAELCRLCSENEDSVMRNGLSARVWRWDTGDYVVARDWAAEMIGACFRNRDRASVPANASLENLLYSGNLAEQWMARVERGESVRSLLSAEICEMESQDFAFLAEPNSRYRWGVSTIPKV